MALKGYRLINTPNYVLCDELRFVKIPKRKHVQPIAITLIYTCTIKVFPRHNLHTHCNTIIARLQIKPHHSKLYLDQIHSLLMHTQYCFYILGVYFGGICVIAYR